MKNKRIILVVVTILMMFLVSCNSLNEVNAETSSSTLELELVSSEYDIAEYRDAETGVHYFIYCNKMGYAGAGGICPRYNADGTLYVD